MENVSEKKIKKLYTKTDIINAIEDIRQKRLIISTASSEYNIPKSTLHDKWKNEELIEAHHRPPTILTKQEEENFIKWIFYCGERGCPVTKFQLLNLVQNYFNTMNRETIFVDNRPCRSWYQSFFSRHPDLTTRIAQNLSLIRVSVTEEKLRQ